MKVNGASQTFLEQVVADVPDGERLKNCIQCGTCGGSCPSGPDMQHTPRKIFAMMNADMKEEVLSANTMWFCVSCYFCMSRCPMRIPITEIMYALKRMAIAEGYTRDTDAPALARAFTHYLDRYGRSFEFGLASRYHLLNRPGALLKMGPMGMSMFMRGRIALLPTRIRQVEQLQAIINKAKELGGAS